MTLYIDNENRIIDVDSTDDNSLTAIELAEDEDTLTGWSDAKISCYKVQVENGYITSLIPYVPTGLIDKISGMQARIAELKESSDMVEEALDGVLAEELPSQLESLADLSDTIDYIMTEVLPNIQG